MLDGQDALAPFQETVGIGGTHQLLDLGSERAELQAEEPKQYAGFTLLAAFLTAFLTAFLAAFLTAFFSDLTVPAVDVFSQHGFELLQRKCGGCVAGSEAEARQDDLLDAERDKGRSLSTAPAGPGGAWRDRRR